MKPPRVSLKAYGREKQRLTVCRRLIPIHNPACDICDIAEGTDYHVLIWQYEYMKDVPILMCRRCTNDFLDHERKIEIGYISHADLLRTGVKEFVVFGESKPEKASEFERRQRRRAEEYNERRREQRKFLRAEREKLKERNAKNRQI